jgi:hypothetical protein
VKTRSPRIPRNASITIHDDKPPGGWKSLLESIRGDADYQALMQQVSVAGSRSSRDDAGASDESHNRELLCGAATKRVADLRPAMPRDGDSLHSPRSLPLIGSHFI